MYIYIYAVNHIVYALYVLMPSTFIHDPISVPIHTSL